MAHGLQVFNSNGDVITDLTKRFAKIIEKKTVTGTGEINVADYGAPNNRFWYFIVSPSTSDTEEILPLLRIIDGGKKIMWKDVGEPLTFYFGVY
ncbi:hypothetical protein [Dialister sp.]|uniref:hypothetical protein n=1 Tax=Dialister sp. TaxID=1955814 RepID=UPI0039A0DDD8